MRRLIHKYLSAHYVVKKNAILRIGDEIHTPSSTLTNELNLIFGLTKKELKWYLKNWIRKQNREFEFNIWWVPKFSLLLPTVGRIYARTISTDLVEVRPLGEPTGISWFHAENDVRVGEYSHPNRNQRPYLTELQRVVDNMTILEFPFFYD